MALSTFDCASFVETAKEYRGDSGSVLLMFDVDGTLKSHMDGNRNRVGRWVDKLLQALCDEPGYHVYLNTGKSRDSLIRNYRAITNLGWYGEHGALYKAPTAAYHDSEFIAYDKNWVETTKEQLKTIRNEMGYRHPNWPGRGKMDPEKLATITFTTKSQNHDFNDFWTRISSELSDNDARVTYHYASGTLMEITPPDVHKGTAVEHLRDQIEHPYHLALAVGDDERDSDMFRAIKTSGITSDPYTVMITEQAGPDTEAQYRLGHYYELLKMLQQLVPDFTDPFPV
ncbi:uncharacterized protein MELLADRAFT_124414 [Melampsora larici-populina 98AG31]|uniref:Sucrose phosphatase-like domain-containing protein n=1 Tax=Melampsora larici-populina (strain 98AG31 / pathotype 3-4-7) TaxID=747676 RepID=F4S2M9_MELLP|nr:uncharacterized protein MELLADRAFT_124414 [Melampsora larici-populina 98AG31]EGG01030.1 hypothetical protein MELLADRAFT_124414 [Melampsora larici-populina 98AG31]